MANFEAFHWKLFVKDKPRNWEECTSTSHVFLSHECKSIENKNKNDADSKMIEILEVGLGTYYPWNDILDANWLWIDYLNGFDDHGIINTGSKNATFWFLYFCTIIKLE